MSVHLRQGRIEDAPAILKLEALFPSDRMPLRSVRRFLRTPNARVWIAEREGRCLGNLILLLRRGGRSARIYSLVVAPAARGRGLARRLVQAAEATATAAGRDSIFLEVRSDNPAARHLYASMGYHESRRLPAFYDDGADGLRLEKVLS